MRPTPNLRAERYRFYPDGWPRLSAGENYGTFVIPRPSGDIRIIASAADEPESCGWEHVSISLENRCPTWGEMQEVKELFWSGDETVVQFHPKASAYIRCHPFCLHLWRKVGEEYELPPKDLIV